ncbi:RagB/SusD family nutrient uptake outer membrane protein [Sphingobacterium phlebotomi]|uniref:RagB/SusD family nutrient uptake outer membrane protein n=1 Tax=Sphingobacterium phlebotomi TaxID=2605433 RepID=A0A5D4H9G0_9SPHI|nr:RagB/SusD family nutrient uptake outer membrane protein [Sphingobacterium phlebotomi]TYR36932.1 RagB/SusD family nutrient uptake outer membrane protein [Sphingobacterium phlebotomi]
MKKSIILIACAFGMLQACNTLDIENYSAVDEERVWNDPNLINAYLADLYTMFGNWSAGADGNNDQVIGIVFEPNHVTIANANFKSWNYTQVRKINTAIQKVEASNLDQLTKDNILGQAYFMRAYAYFDMVKYHGGVPYVKVPQELSDELNVPRNSTLECFNYMVEDLDKAISLLPQKLEKTSGDYGKIDGNFATAFKAKVLLYKASPQFNPNNPYANTYWNEAYEANKAAYEQLLADGFVLTEDYSDIALVERGPEVVFAVLNAFPNKVGIWDSAVRPGSESRGVAGAVPTWEMVKSFPMLDGKQYDDPSGAYYQPASDFLQHYWENRDPRFEKSIVWNGKLYPVSGKVGNRQYTAEGIAHTLDYFATSSANYNRYSGFFILKNSKLSLAQSTVDTQYDVDFVLMRFAEIMLNYAEAANEKDQLNVALDLLKQIRERAGIEPGTDGNYGIKASNKAQMREAILQERHVEFCFEGHRFWDLRRLRLLDRLNGTTEHGVEAKPINADGSDVTGDAAWNQLVAKAENNELVETDFRYVLRQVPVTGVTHNAIPETYYFFPIQQSVIDKNPKIQQNNNWGGTFNPTIE